MVKLNEHNREQYIKFILDALNANEIKIFRSTFLELHPSDQADFFANIGEDERGKMYNYLSPEELAELFEGLNIHDQILFFKEMDERYSSQMLNNMFTDDVVTFLTEINGEKADEILEKMDLEKAEKVEILMSYDPETAGAIMTKEFISIASTEIAESVIERLRKVAPAAEIIYYNYVVDEAGALVGVVSLRDLITADPEEEIENIMSTRVVSVPDQMDQEEVASVIQKYDFLAVPVVTKHNHLLGIVTVDDVIDIIEAETTEDFGEISATKGATDVNLSALTAAKKRSPWIVALMVLGLITAGVIKQFEETLEQVLILSFFIPMIMDSAGNVGTQSLAVSVRGLALGTIQHGRFWRMVQRELSTGFMIGFLCMLLISILIPLIFGFGNWLIGIVIGISILATLSISAVIGSIVPLIINKLKFDPAIASGPFITTINDIIGLLIYFTIAKSLLDVI